MLSNIFVGFSTIFEFHYFSMLFLGTFIGMLGGATPGISSGMIIILAVPLTYAMDAISAMILLIGLYVGAVVGGSITAILFNIPGTPESIATSLDGNKMAKLGKAGEALGVAIISSTIGGIFGAIVLLLVAPQLANIALTFGPPEYFALAFLGIVAISSIETKEPHKGFVSASLGLLISTIGASNIASVERFTFGIPILSGGINYVAVFLGCFAFTEVFKQVKSTSSLKNIKNEEENEKLTKVIRKNFMFILPSFNFLRGSLQLFLRNSIVGVIIGIIPGIGATTAAIFGYNLEERFSKKRKIFGTGIPEGVAAPETANNAACAGTMVPFLTLGIPGGGVTAIMLGALTLHGIRPGPLVFFQQTKLMYTIFAAMFVVYCCMFIIAIFICYLWGKISTFPFRFLAPFIIIFGVVGAFSIRNVWFDVIVLFISGIIGYILQQFNYPIGPLVIAMILGPIAESSFSRSLIIYDSFAEVLKRPVFIVLILLSLVIFFSAIISNVGKAKKDNMNITQI
ncbi:MAG: tripartite tricarboxylate transporter permease [Atribacterota bacterium]|nr:tripartite tricarboxylate transporter permease [Atribacterota bacterium]